MAVAEAGWEQGDGLQAGRRAGRVCPYLLPHRRGKGGDMKAQEEEYEQKFNNPFQVGGWVGEWSACLPASCRDARRVASAALFV